MVAGRWSELRRASSSRVFQKARTVVAVTVGIIVGIAVGCTLAFSQVNRSPALCDSTATVNKLRSDLSHLRDWNNQLTRTIQYLDLKFQNSELTKIQEQKISAPQLESKQFAPAAGPFGSVKAPRTGPTVAPDRSVNPRLACLLHGVAIDHELIVALANSDMEPELEVWLESIARAGIKNYLVVALDDGTESFCRRKNASVYRPDLDGALDSIARNGSSHQVSNLKFLILREFLQLGHSILVSDVDVVYLQNPFDRHRRHLYRDSDVEAMSDGHTEATAYGLDDISEDPSMGWGIAAHTMRIWVYNSGLFYIRPTLASIELLDRVAARVIYSEGKELWDQMVFNEELFYPSHPGYEGLHASRRTMDMYLFMNSKVLFKVLRHSSKISSIRPVAVHVNYHPDKLERMKAIVDFYVHGKKDALKPFPDGTSI